MRQQERAYTLLLWRRGIAQVEGSCRADDFSAKVIWKSGTKTWEESMQEDLSLYGILPMDDANCAKLAAAEIADMFSGQYQVCYEVHEDTECLHIHFAINAVSFVNGKKWHKSKNELKEMEAQIRERAKVDFYNF